MSESFRNTQEGQRMSGKHNVPGGPFTRYADLLVQLFYDYKLLPFSWVFSVQEGTFSGKGEGETKENLRRQP